MLPTLRRAPPNDLLHPQTVPSYYTYPKLNMIYHEYYSFINCKHWLQLFRIYHFVVERINMGGTPCSLQLNGGTRTRIRVTIVSIISDKFYRSNVSTKISH